jgi:hypothetical protein
MRARPTSGPSTAPVLSRRESLGPSTTPTSRKTIWNRYQDLTFTAYVTDAATERTEQRRFRAEDSAAPHWMEALAQSRWTAVRAALVPPEPVNAASCPQTRLA